MSACEGERERGRQISGGSEEKGKERDGSNMVRTIKCHVKNINITLNSLNHVGIGRAR